MTIVKHSSLSSEVSNLKLSQQKQFFSSDVCSLHIFSRNDYSPYKFLLMYSRPSIYMGFTSSDSIDHGSKFHLWLVESMGVKCMKSSYRGLIVYLLKKCWLYLCSLYNILYNKPVTANKVFP